MKTWQKLVTVLLAATVAVSLSGCSIFRDDPTSEPANDAASESVDSTGPDAAEVAISVEWPNFESIEEIGKHADLVIEAQFTDSWEAQGTSRHGVVYDPPSAELSSGHLPTTISGVSIVSVLKGDVASGSTIDVAQIGGHLEGNHYVERHTTLLSQAESDSVVLFLTLPEAGSYELIHPTQGMFLVDFDGSARPLTDEAGFQVTTLDEIWKRLDEA